MGTTGTRTWLRCSPQTRPQELHVQHPSTGCATVPVARASATGGFTRNAQRTESTGRPQTRSRRRHRRDRRTSRHQPPTSQCDLPQPAAMVRGAKHNPPATSAGQNEEGTRAVWSNHAGTTAWPHLTSPEPGADSRLRVFWELVDAAPGAGHRRRPPLLGETVGTDRAPGVLGAPTPGQTSGPSEVAPRQSRRHRMRQILAGARHPGAFMDETACPHPAPVSPLRSSSDATRLGCRASAGNPTQHSRSRRSRRQHSGIAVVPQRRV